MSLLLAEKVSCNLKQNQGVASLTNFCDAEPIKKISYGEDRRNYSKFVLSQIFRIRQATKRGKDSLKQKSFTTCKKLRLNFDLQSWLEILKFFPGAIFAIFSLASVFCRRASSKMSNHQSSYSANQIVRHVEVNTFVWSFSVSNTESESEMFSEIQPNRGSQKYQVISHEK